MLATVMFSVAAMAQSGKACCSKKGDASSCSKKDLARQRLVALKKELMLLLAPKILQ
ncbi:MAG: hypothetical protein IPL35_01270 [Sphingobacteriales bacterium]|nr:hypothetical protein [Sphingobacteriales bacterium]